MPKSSQKRKTRSNGSKHQSRIAFSPLLDDSSGNKSAPNPENCRVAELSINLRPRRQADSQKVIRTISASSSPLSSPPPSPKASSSSESRAPPIKAGAETLEKLTSTPSPSTTSLNEANEPRTRSSDARTKAQFMPPPAVQWQREIFNDVESGEEEDDDEIVSPAAKRRRLSSAFNKNKKTEPSDDDKHVKRRRQKPLLHRQQRASSFIDDEPEKEGEEKSGDEGYESQASRKSETGQKKKQSRKSHYREREDLKEDLEFLKGSESPTNSSPKQQKRPSKSENKRQALEMLKQRRLSRQEHKSSKGDRTALLVVIDSGDDDEDNDSSSSISLEVNTDELDADVDGFVVADDEDQKRVQLPLQFSRLQTSKTDELFEIVVEWMVQKKLNPGFAMHGEEYKFAYDRMNDFARGLASEYRSSAWTAEFNKALKAQPNFDYIRLDRDHEQEKCDACNRTNHPATYEVTFNGRPYDRFTLEQLSDEEILARDLGDEDTICSVGRFCMANAQVAHSLEHWRYRLNEWTVGQLENEGYCTPEKEAERTSWGPGRCHEYANKVVETMAANGDIKALYIDFKRELKEAQLSSEGRFSRQSLD